MKQLSSRHHPLVAACKALARGRGGDDRLLLDGLHLLDDALRAGLRLETVAMTPAFAESGDGRRVIAALASTGTETVQVSEAVLAAMSPVSTPSGVIAVAARPSWTLADVFASAPQLVLVATDIQEPGNVGAIARSAEACGATGVVFAGASADPFGWKALRGAMGSSLRLPVAASRSCDTVLAAARALGIRVAATVPRGGHDPHDVDLRGPIAIVLGGEGPGLAPDLVDAADLRLSIPMHGPIESLNVAVAAAILVYEAFRQRRST
jgi:RNA methyltransferase, TrmH family